MLFFHITITKTITFTEIVKHKVQGLHQLSKLQYRNIQEVWENQEGVRVNVHKTVPSIYILLSKKPVDPQELGYQSPTETSSRSEEKEHAAAYRNYWKKTLQAFLSCDFAYS